jgi:hypothetical protein
VINNTIVGGTTGIRVDRRVPTATQIYRNNIITGNGVGFQTEFGSEANNPTWQNNLVSGNTTNYAGITDPTGINGNITGDPLFEDAAARNYRLLGGSPAIDAGSNLLVPAVFSPSPMLDFDLMPRISDGNGDGIEIADIGAYEFAGIVVGSIDLVVAGGDLQECLSPQGNTVEAKITTLPENLELTSVELFLNGTSVANTRVSQVTLPMGTHRLVAVALTASGNELRSERTVDVVDTTAPVIQARFVDRRTNKELLSIDDKCMTFVTVKIAVEDVCDPNPKADSMLGTGVKDGDGLRFTGQLDQLTLKTEKLTLKVMATDASGNVSVQTKELLVQGPKSQVKDKGVEPPSHRRWPWFSRR